MRYIIDSALLQAGLLNRTLVIPSFIYARTCEYELYVKFYRLTLVISLPPLRMQHSLCGLCNYGQ